MKTKSYIMHSGQYFKCRSVSVFLFCLIALIVSGGHSTQAAPKRRNTGETSVGVQESFEDRWNRLDKLISKDIKVKSSSSGLTESLIKHIALLDEWMEIEKPSIRPTGSVHMNGIDVKLYDNMLAAQENKINSDQLLDWYKQLFTSTNLGNRQVYSFVKYLLLYQVTLDDLLSALSRINESKLSNSANSQVINRKKGAKKVAIETPISLISNSYQSFLKLYTTFDRHVVRILDWLNLIRGELNTSSHLDKCLELFEAFGKDFKKLKAWIDIFNDDANLPLVKILETAEAEKKGSPSPQGKGWSSDAFREFINYFPKEEVTKEAIISYWLDQYTLKVDDKDYQDYVKNLCILKSCIAAQIAVEHGLDLSVLIRDGKNICDVDSDTDYGKYFPNALPLRVVCFLSVIKRDKQEEQELDKFVKYASINPCHGLLYMFSFLAGMPTQFFDHCLEACSFQNNEANNEAKPLLAKLLCSTKMEFDFPDVAEIGKTKERIVLQGSIVQGDHAICVEIANAAIKNYQLFSSERDFSLQNSNSLSFNANRIPAESRYYCSEMIQVRLRIDRYRREYITGCIQSILGEEQQPGHSSELSPPSSLVEEICANAIGGDQTLKDLLRTSQGDFGILEAILRNNLHENEDHLKVIHSALSEGFPLPLLRHILIKHKPGYSPEETNWKGIQKMTHYYLNDICCVYPIFREIFRNNSGEEAFKNQLEEISKYLFQVFYRIGTESVSDATNFWKSEVQKFIHLVSLVPQFNDIINSSEVTTITKFLSCLAPIGAYIPECPKNYAHQLRDFFGQFSEVSGHDFIIIYKSYLDTRIWNFDTHRLTILNEQLSSYVNYSHRIVDKRRHLKSNMYHPSYPSFVALCGGGKFASCYLWDTWRKSVKDSNYHSDLRSRLENSPEVRAFADCTKDFLSDLGAGMLYDKGYNSIDIKELYKEGFKDFYLLVASHSKIDVRGGIDKYRSDYKPQNINEDQRDNQKAQLQLLACLFYPKGGYPHSSLHRLSLPNYTESDQMLDFAVRNRVMEVDENFSNIIYMEMGENISAMNSSYLFHLIQEGKKSNWNCEIVKLCLANDKKRGLNLAKKLAADCGVDTTFTAPIVGDIPPFKGVYQIDIMKLAIYLKQMGFGDLLATSLARMIRSQTYMKRVLNLFNMETTDLCQNQKPELLELLRLIFLARLPIGNLMQLKEDDKLKSRESIIELIRAFQEFSEISKKDEQNIQNKLQDILHEGQPTITL